MMTVFVYEHLTAQEDRLKAEPEDRLKAELQRGPPFVGVPPLGGLPALAGLLREGRAMRDAIVADLRAIPHVFVRAAITDDEGAFRKNAAASDYSLIIAPESNGTLETRCRWVEEAGGSLLGPSSAAVRLTADKFAMFQHFQGLGIPTPRTWLLGEEPRQFPMVWKPRDGAGSQLTFLIESSRDRRRCYKQLNVERFSAAGMLVQEYAPGMPGSVAFLVGSTVTIPLPPCSQQLSVDGRFSYEGGSTPLPDNLADRATEIARRAVDSVPGLLGYVGVDVVLGASAADDRVIEINPRLTTSYIGLRELADFNLAEEMLRLIHLAERDEYDGNLERTWKSGQVQFTPDRATFSKST